MAEDGEGISVHCLAGIPSSLSPFIFLFFKLWGVVGIFSCWEWAQKSGGFSVEFLNHRSGAHPDGKPVMQQVFRKPYGNELLEESGLNLDLGTPTNCQL